jgi:segregation and condensation protein B
VPPSNPIPALEALLFSSDQPLTLALLAESIDLEPEAIEASLRELGEAYAERGAGVELREIAGGWMLVTTPAQAEWVGRMLRGKRKMRLSRAGLETMAIVAYKQPVTKTEIEAIRGVDSTGVLATLLERNLVTIRGRSKVVGRPLLYGTTPEFLDYFGLKDLSELPRPEELRALIAAREPEQLEMIEVEEAVSAVAADLALAEASAASAREAGEGLADAVARGEATENELAAVAADATEVSDMGVADDDDDDDDEYDDEFEDDDADDDADDDDEEDADEVEPDHDAPAHHS